MLRNSQGPQRQRLLNKFTENDYEKVDRLMELHFTYLDKVRVLDETIEKEKMVNELLLLTYALHTFYIILHFLLV